LKKSDIIGIIYLSIINIFFGMASLNGALA